MDDGFFRYIGSARLGFWLVMAVTVPFTAGCNTFEPGYDPGATPPSLQLETGPVSEESILDELPSGPVGDLAPPAELGPEALVQAIEMAKAECNRDAYREHRRKLQEGATAEARAIQAAGGDPYADSRIMYMHEALIRLPERIECNKILAGYQPEVGMTLEAGIAGVNIALPAYRFLGTEIGGVPNLDNGYRLEDDEQTKTLHVGGSLDLGRIGLDGLSFSGKTKLNFGLSYTDVSLDANTGAFDPNGASLLIPGTGDGPFGAGFSLPDAGGLNVVTGSNYLLDYNHTSFHAKLSEEFWCDEEEGSGIGFLPYLGLSYTRGNFDQRFGGSIPGFARDFEYNTRVDVESWGPIFGAQFLLPVKGSPVTLRAGATGSVEFNDADGSDSLDFTGFARQTMQMSNDDATFSYTLNAGVTVGARAPIQFDIDGFYGGIGNTPVVTRDGVGASRLELERSDYAGAMLRTRFSF